MADEKAIVWRLRQAEIQLRHLPLDEFPDSRELLADWIAAGCDLAEAQAQEIARLIESDADSVRWEQLARDRGRVLDKAEEEIAQLRADLSRIGTDCDHVNSELAAIDCLPEIESRPETNTYTRVEAALKVARQRTLRKGGRNGGNG